MTILLVSPLPPPAGGIATWTVMYREYCQSNDIPVRIVNTALQGARAEKKGNKFRVFEEIKRTRYVLHAFRKALKQQRPDVVHLNTSCSRFGILRDCLCVLRARRHQVPVVLQCHCNIEDQLKGKLAVRAFRIAAQKSAAVWVLNRPSADFAKKQTTTQVKVVPNFIGTNRIAERQGIRPQIEKAVFVGHVRREKGAVEILEAAQQFPQITFVLVGPVQQDMAAMPKPGNVVLTGSQPLENVQQYLMDTDVFLFPSYTEGFANALLEAMATGLPVIATDVGANKEMLEAAGGAIIPVGRSDLLCAELEKMNASPALRQQASAWNLQKVKTQYTTDVVLGNMMNSYEEIVKQ